MHSLLRLSGGILALLPLTILPALAAAEAGGITLAGSAESVVLTLDLKAGEWVDYSWSANISLDLRIEKVGAATPVVDRAGQVGNGAFQAPTDGSYRFEFRNRNDEAAGGQWTITKRAEFPLVIVLLGAILAVAAVAFLAARRRGKKPSPPEKPPTAP